MPARTFVVIPKSVHAAITAWADGAYPHEGCGLLIGRFRPDGGKEVARLAPLANDLLSGRRDHAATLPADRRGEDAGRTEFVMNPADYQRAALDAEREGLDVVGVIHTHPDHPPRPSAIDAAQPFLAQWSNVIVAVENGKTREMKSWFRETDAEPFAEEEIRVAAAAE